MANHQEDKLMSRRPFCVWLGVLLPLFAAVTAEAQIYPDRPIRVIVAAGAGSVADITTRIVADKIRDILGQSLIVENRPTAGGMIGLEEVVRAPPDGYTLLVGNTNTNALLPALQSKKLKFDARADIGAISLMSESVAPLVLAPISLPASNIAELVRYAKQNPGKLNYSSAGPGSIAHIDILSFSKLANIELVHVPMQSANAAVPALVTGDVHIGFFPITMADSLIKAGKLKAIAVAGRERNPLYPEVMTFAEAGYPVGTVLWQGMFAPAGVAPDRIEIMFDAVKKTIERDDVKAAFERSFLIPRTSQSPKEFSNWLGAEMDRLAGLVKANKLELD